MSSRSPRPSLRSLSSVAFSARRYADDTYQHLRVFEDVVSLVLNNYVEEVDVNRAMKGAMSGLADGLDADSAFLTPVLVKNLESNDEGGGGDVGLELDATILSAGGRGAGRIAGRQSRAPDRRLHARASTIVRPATCRRSKAVRLLRGAPGTKVSLLVIRGNAADPHEVSSSANASPRKSPHGWPMPRRATSESPRSRTVAGAAEAGFDALAKTGAKRYVIDVRGTARGDIDEGIAAARLFVKSGTLTIRQTKGDHREIVPAQAGEARSPRRSCCSSDSGTSGAAEVFAAALDGNDRAELVGGRTLGRAARQRLVKLPDGSGLWLSAPAISHARRRSASREGARARRRGRSARGRVRQRAARDRHDAAAGARVSRGEEGSVERSPSSRRRRCERPLA